MQLHGRNVLNTMLQVCPGCISRVGLAALSQDYASQHHSSYDQFAAAYGAKEAQQQQVCWLWGQQGQGPGWQAAEVQRLQAGVVLQRRVPEGALEGPQEGLQGGQEEVVHAGDHLERHAASVPCSCSGSTVKVVKVQRRAWLVAVLLLCMTSGCVHVMESVELM